MSDVELAARARWHAVRGMLRWIPDRPVGAIVGGVVATRGIRYRISATLGRRCHPRMDSLAGRARRSLRLLRRREVYSPPLLRDSLRSGAGWPLRLAFIGGCIILASLGQLAFGGVAWYAGIGLCGSLIVVEMLRSSSSLARVEKRLERAQSCACMFTGAPGNATTGLWKGIRVQVGSTDIGPRIGVPLGKLPAELVVEQRQRASEPGQGVRTGDDAFDRLLRIGGTDEGPWRCVLTAEMRSMLASLSERATVSVHNQALDVQLTDLQSKTLEDLLDRAVAFAVAVPEPADDPLATVFAIARNEAVAGVRAGHYRWLAGCGWNTHEVYRAASADPNPAIAEWGRSHLPPSDGVFR